MTDKERFLKQAKAYIGKDGNYVCKVKLGLPDVYHWCAYAVTCIMKDCGFLGVYVKEIEGGAGSIPRNSDGKYGTWYKKYATAHPYPVPGDLIFFRYANYPNQDKYFCDHVGIVLSFNEKTKDITTLEGNVQGVNGNWERTSSFKQLTRNFYDNSVYAFYTPKWKNEITFNNPIGGKTTGTSNNKNNADDIIVGDKVNVVRAIQYDNGKPFYAITGIPYNVVEVVRDRVVIGRNGSIIAAVNKCNLKKVRGTAETYVTVQSGDTLFWIAKRNGITLDQIKRLNPQIKDYDLIYIGQKVRIK